MIFPRGPRRKRVLISTALLARDTKKVISTGMPRIIAESTANDSDMPSAPGVIKKKIPRLEKTETPSD